MVRKTRGLLYQIARLLGDYQAVSSGSSKKMKHRAKHRVAGRAVGKGMRKFLK